MRNIDTTSMHAVDFFHVDCTVMVWRIYVLFALEVVLAFARDTFARDHIECDDPRRAPRAPPVRADAVIVQGA